jgi:hypothetical protein
MTRITFKPNWNCDDKSAPFKRNDRMLEIVPAREMPTGLSISSLAQALTRSAEYEFRQALMGGTA